MSKRKRGAESRGEKARSSKFRAVATDSIEDSSPSEPALVPSDGLPAAHQHVQQPASRAGHDSEWTVKAPVGGRILNIDPLFSKDDLFFLVAYATKVKVFSRATGLCVRSLPTKSKSTVVATSLSHADPSLVYIGLTFGRIELWDWTEGVRRNQWDIGAPLTNLAVAGVQDQDKCEDLLYVVDHAKEKWNVTAHRLSISKGEDVSEVRTLYTRDTPIESLHISGNGRIAAIHSGKEIIIGSQRGGKTFPLSALRYTWRTFDCSAQITTMSLNLTNEANVGISSTVDLAVGTTTGVIFVYRDVLNALVNLQNSSKQTIPVSRYHWHRNAVGALAWSKDGSYVISGGMETVLVLWQLDTNQKSFLPHLAAAIQKLAVSSSGSFYGLVLGDNSSLLLNTLDFKPALRVSEPQLSFRSRAVPYSKLLRMPRSVNEIYPQRRPALDVVQPSSKIVTSSPSAPRQHVPLGQSSASPFLQVIDQRSGHEMFKQALTRTKVTDRNMGPHGNVLDEPDVVLLRTSADGKWLATVDEWVPPAKDREPFGEEPVAGRQLSPPGLEAYLKFWQWGESSQRWELVWRVDLTDAANQDQRKGMVLDIVEDQSRTRFFTLAGDMVIRAWEPRQKTRRGVPVQDSSYTHSSSWAGYDIAALDESELFSDKNLSARLAVSQDGSLLAACVSGVSKSFAGLFDLSTRKRIALQTGRLYGPVLGADFVGESLVILSDDTTIWDLVDSRWTRILENTDFDGEIHRPNQVKHLALDSRREVVAIALPVLEQRSRIAIFTPESKTVECVLEIPSLLRALLPSPSREGFVAIGSNAEIYTIAGTGAAVAEAESSTVELAEVYSGGLSRIFGGTDRQAPSQQAVESAGPNLLTSGLRSKDAQLSEMLARNQPLSMPSMMSMFKQVSSTLSQ